MKPAKAGETKKPVEAKKAPEPKPGSKPAPSGKTGKTALPSKPIVAKEGKPVQPSAAGPSKPPATDPKKSMEVKVVPGAGGKKPPVKGGKSDATPAPVGAKFRYTTTSAEAMAAGRAAAAKLAAAAGLNSIKNTFNGEIEEDTTPRLTKSPFGKKELKEFREALIDKRRQLATDVESMESEALHGGGSGSLSHLPQHMADQGTDTYDQTLNLDLAASQRGLLKEIDDALRRIEEGTFGVCERLGRPIHLERLKHTPWARFSIEAARQMERTSLLR